MNLAKLAASICGCLAKIDLAKPATGQYRFECVIFVIVVAAATHRYHMQLSTLLPRAAEAAFLEDRVVDIDCYLYDVHRLDNIALQFFLALPNFSQVFDIS